jgi:hypothetical protein
MHSYNYSTADSKFISACKSGDLIEVTLFYGLNEISTPALDAGLHMATKYDHPDVAYWVYTLIQDGIRYFQ